MVAQEVGLEELPGRSWSACPSCGARQRGSSDRRGPVGLRADGNGWRCHRCKEGGDALSLVAVAVTGSTAPNSWTDVRRFCADRGWCSGDGSSHQPVRIRRPPPPAPRVLRRPPVDEVHALWDACEPAYANHLASAWLNSRGLDPRAVDNEILARALPESPADLPGWAFFGAQPWTWHHNLVVPMYDASGALRSLQARACSEHERKSLNARGADVGGLVFANEFGVAVLRGSMVGARVIVAEGIPDYLTWSLAMIARTPPVAVLGVVAGSWPSGEVGAELAARISDGSEVLVATHRGDRDGTGDKYAEHIQQTLAHCRVSRWKGRQQ